MIQWPKKSVDAVAYLLRFYNDIDVFVEDARFKVIYELILSRILDKKARVRNVIPLNGRANVLDKCRQDQSPGGRRRIYIIDGDLDLMLQRPKEKLKRLCRLNVYCIENLLICENAIVEICYESHGDISKTEIKNHFEYKAWKKHTTNSLIKLFALYAVCYENLLPFPTVSYNALSLCEGRGTSRSLSNSKISDRYKKLRKNVMSRMLAKDLDQRVNEIMRTIRALPTDKANYISAKTHLLPLLHLKMKTQVKALGNLDGIKGRLARYCDINIDPELSTAVKSVARGRVWL